MKGLLLKDFYLLRRYCRFYLLIIAAFIAISAVDDSIFYLVYPCALAGMIPMTLQSYDERERWTTYSGTLPYTKAQLVSAKYVIGLLLSALAVGLTVLAQILRIMGRGPIPAEQFAATIVSVTAVSLAAPALLMPFIFRFGAEKGRIVYYCMVGVICGVGTAFTVLGNFSLPVNGTAWLLLIASGAGLLYALSWRLSIAFYQKREI